MFNQTDSHTCIHPRYFQCFKVYVSKHESTKPRPGVGHYFLMLSDKLRTCRGYFREQDELQIICCRANLSLRSSLSCLTLITPFLRAGGRTEPGNDRLEGVCVSRRERDRQWSISVLDNVRSCLSDTVQSKGALCRSQSAKGQKGQKRKSANKQKKSCLQMCNSVKTVFTAGLIIIILSQNNTVYFHPTSQWMMPKIHCSISAAASAERWRCAPFVLMYSDPSSVIM